MDRFLLSKKFGKRRIESASKHVESGGSVGQKKFRQTKELMTETYSLSDKQFQCVKAILEGSSVFFTGSAGTGKRYLLAFISLVR